MSAGVSVSVTVRGIAAGGSGVADLPDGRVVFVPRTAPGDRVDIQVEKSKRRWALGSVRAVLEASPDRRKPLCSLYDTCGGCQLQHLTYETQLKWKARFVRDALTRIGGVTALEELEVVPSPLEAEYRNRITFTLRRLEGARVVAGFHALGRPAHIVDVTRECVLPRPALAGVWRAMRAAWGPGAELLPVGGRLRLTLREEDSGAVSLLVEGGRPGWSAEALARAVPTLASIRHSTSEDEGTARVVAGSADDGSTAFAQVNPEAAALLVEHVLALAGDARAVVDAYCGSGAYARPLAARGSAVTGIELHADACYAARLDAPAGLVVLEGRVEDLLDDALADVPHADLLIVNPPRQGLGAEVVRIVNARAPKTLIYVSCDPATLARDVEALSSVYECGPIKSFDLFPQTAHVETVLLLHAKGTAA